MEHWRGIGLDHPLILNLGRCEILRHGFPAHRAHIAVKLSGSKQLGKDRLDTARTMKFLPEVFACRHEIDQ